MDLFGTLGPACCSEEVLEEMFKAGMTGVRLNLSHSNLEDCKQWIMELDMAARACSVERKLLMDLQGPELRMGSVKQELTLKEGEYVYLKEPGTEQMEDIPVPKQVLWELKKDYHIQLDDGKILLEVHSLYDQNDKEVEESCGFGGKVKCKILRGGTLTSRKSIAVNECNISLPTLTPADIKNIGMAKKFGVTGVMLPFVRNKEDILCLRKTLNEAGCEQIRIYAKIENLEGVKQLESFLEVCDEIVIARGDLGNAIELYRLPRLQEEIAELCVEKGKRFMVVTQMLASMEHAKVPTRAEVNDIYHAVKQGASSLMVTGETAVGSYPVEVMKVLRDTAQTALR
ncbi:MAG: pyruvate kinase [Lachnospiraceae bacterium]|nr:pyruvate kinase [Lachnospiraceae bacterium]